MAAAVERIVVQATAQDKKAIAAKAKKLDLPISELMRRGAFAYETSEADGELSALADAASAMLEALTDDLLTSEFMCRMCDELACPDARCPVERAEPAPPHRRGTGYGVVDPVPR